MGRSSGMGQLAKGVVIGVVLLLAIIGTKTIFDSAKDSKNNPSYNNQRTTTAEIPDTSININADQKNKSDQTPSENPATTPVDRDKDLIPLDTTEKANKETSKTSNNTFKPTLENERPLKDVPISEKDKVKFGLLQVSAVNPSNKQKVLASFVVLDNKGKKVAKAKNKKQISFRLPIGKYKVIATLKKPDDAVRNTQRVQSTKTVRINTNKKTTQSFSLEPLSTLGVLQVSAKNVKNGQTIKANYIIQKENGQTIATRNNVTHTLFKLKAGSYKVTVKSGNSSDFRTVVVEPGESTKQVFKLQETIKLGKVRVRVFDTQFNKPLNANIIIATSKGVTIQELKAVSQTEVSLPAGRYKIRVTGPTGQSSKVINITAGRALNEIFRFDAPNNASVNNVKVIKTTEKPKQTQQPTTTPKVDPKVVTPPAKPIQEVKKQVQAKGSILLYARNNGDNTPLKSNFYIQKPNGKNITKKVYSESAQFSLEPGVYKITVRSKNRKNLTKTIRVTPGGRTSEVFSLVSTLPKPSPVKSATKQQATAPVLAPPKPSKPVSVKKVAIIPAGFLNIAMKPPKKTHFIVATKAGKKIVELTSAPSANFKLDTGDYVVTAIQNKKRRTKTVKVRKNKTTHIRFNAANFASPKKEPVSTPPALVKGTLKSRIIDRDGRPLRGNLTVVNVHGQVIARANAVSVGVFNLPPEPHTIILNYKGLRGSERINIRSRETTMHTFTVEPNRSRPDYEQAPPEDEQPSTRDMIRERLEREIRKRF